jgi:hypothetical protein
MSYCSDVGLMFYTTNQKEVPFPVIKFWFDENFPKKEAENKWVARIDYGDDYVYVFYSSVKWYDGYDHPKKVRNAIANFCHAFKDKSEYVAYDFIRIGEDDTDIEFDYSEYSEYRLGCRREIVIN